MAEASTSSGAAQTPARPFPWFCPKCRRKAVRRVTIPYRCERLHNGHPITVVLENFSVPRCDHCGELVFDYDAEQQIKEALAATPTGEGIPCPPTMDGRWVFVFTYRRRGQTTHWEAVSPGRCDRSGPDDQWTDGEVRVEQQGDTVIITVYSEESLQEAEATPAEELANEEFEKQFPGHTIVYPSDEPRP